MRYRTSHTVIVETIIILLALWTVGCAVFMFTKPEVNCSSGIVFATDSPKETRLMIDKACHNYQQATGAKEKEMQQAMNNLVVRFVLHDDQRFCTPSGGACTTPWHMEVPRDHGWRQALLHEATHVLLFHLQPELETEQHHRWMYDNNLCYNGCGDIIWDSTKDWDRW